MQGMDHGDAVGSKWPGFHHGHFQAPLQGWHRSGSHFKFEGSVFLCGKALGVWVFLQNWF
jgi:hypothetical protein